MNKWAIENSQGAMVFSLLTGQPAVFDNKSEADEARADLDFEFRPQRYRVVPAPTEAQEVVMRDAVWTGEGWIPRTPVTKADELRAMLDRLRRERIPPWDYRHLLTPPRGPLTVTETTASESPPLSSRTSDT